MYFIGSKFNGGNKPSHQTATVVDMNGNAAERLETSSNESGIGPTTGDESPAGDDGARQLAGQLGAHITLIAPT